MDPIQLGEELADYLLEKETRYHNSLVLLGVLNEDGTILNDASYSLMRLLWERDFWRAKALGEDIKF